MAMSAALLLLHRRRCLVAVVSPPSSRRRRLAAVVSSPVSGGFWPSSSSCMQVVFSCCVTHLSCHRSGHKLADDPGSCYNHYFYNMLGGPLANRRPLRQGHVSTAVGTSRNVGTSGRLRQVPVIALAACWPMNQVSMSERPDRRGCRSVSREITESEKGAGRPPAV